jgi:dihydroorotate dehydrogenase (NAD+) catalytic subunit
MSRFFTELAESLKSSRLNELGISSPFTIPSGIVTTVPSVVAKIAGEVPEIGFLTTKTISVEPRIGYREPILHEYYPGCFVNAVGLANPGAKVFRAAMEPLLPLSEKKPLIVSVMGASAEEFAECAEIVSPIADALELNFSCPHVKGAGQSIGSDPDAVRSIIQLLRKRTDKPLIPKLSPNLGNISAMASLCQGAGADALTLINTVGPGVVTDTAGRPVLTNVAGGMSGAGVLPIGIKAVREAAEVVSIPIIACGGITSADDVRSYRRAGATLFGVGSALAGMTTPEIASYFSDLVQSLETDTGRTSPRTSFPAHKRTEYVSTVVRDVRSAGGNLFRVELEDGHGCDPGRFFFLRLAGVGEKPFSPASDDPAVYYVRTVGPFTEALSRLQPGDEIQYRGPYGKGFLQLADADRVVLLAGGTGAAPTGMAGKILKDAVVRSYIGFSAQVEPWLQEELAASHPALSIVTDPPGNPGEVVRRLTRDLEDQPGLFRGCVMFMCGPGPMMRAAVEVVTRVAPDLRIYTAREDIMRCGIGICGSCGTPSGYRSCVDGPVMAPDF